MIGRTVLAAAVMAGFAAAPLVAQQPAMRHPAHAGMMHQGMGDMQGMMGAEMDSMMGPMTQAMASVPEHLLAMKTKLSLTSQQQSQLTTLRDAARGQADEASRSAAMHLREMVQVMHAAQPDTNAVKTHFQAAMRFMEQAHWAMVRSATEAWPVLTAAQQHQVSAMADSMGNHGMMHQGMRH